MIIKKRTIFFVCFIGTQILSAQEWDPIVEDCINQTNLDSLVQTVRILSGEDSVTIGGRSYRIVYRDFNTFDCELAALYIKQKLEGYGLPTYVQLFNGPEEFSDRIGRNVYAIQMGTEHPEEEYIICAHYDAAAGPGADDNASGTAAVLEAVRILSQIESKKTIIYALWDAEEYVKWGSRAYAAEADSTNENIAGVINCEMFGWDSNDDGLMDIHTADIADSPMLAEVINNVRVLYNIDLEPVIYNPGTNGSDHNSFWHYYYSAVVMSQAFWGGDINLYYHSAEDKIDKFNLTYFHDMSKLAVASIAYFAQGNSLTYMDDFSNRPVTFKLDQNYPNPFNAETIIQYQIPKNEHVKLSVYNILGEEISILLDERKPAGYYSVYLDGNEFNTGTYIYRLSVGKISLSRKMLIVK